MVAKLKCSACGVQVDQIKMPASRDKRNAAIILTLPFIAVVCWLVWDSFSAPNFHQDLQLKTTQTQVNDGILTLDGLIDNTSGKSWENLTIEAEFYSETGQFLGEISKKAEVISRPDSKSDFSLIMKPIPPTFIPGKGQIKTKVTNATES